MKIKIGILLLLWMLAIQVQAQAIKGKIIDKNGDPIVSAVVVVQTDDTIHVGSAFTDSLGVFTIKTDVSSFMITVQHLAYEIYQNSYHSPIIGNIEMVDKNVMISDVSIKGERALVRFIDGKMTYDLPQLLKDKIAVNAYEAILELPGVLQQNGKIELAGANKVTVTINGKATNMSENQLENLLKNMPKERIQEVEIMYSASPQYHVRGYHQSCSKK